MGRTSRKTLSLCKDGWAADLVILSADKSICRRPGDLRVKIVEWQNSNSAPASQ